MVFKAPRPGLGEVKEMKFILLFLLIVIFILICLRSCMSGYDRNMPEIENSEDKDGM